MGNAADRLDAVVVGAGQAGLALGYHLAQRGRRFQIVDAAPAIGHTWATRWDSLVLFTPARYDALPGMAFPAEPDTHPTKDHVAEYLAAYAAAFALPVRQQTAVTSVRRDGSGYVVDTSRETLTSANVVVATGPFQQPVVPPVAAGLAPEVTQLHSSAYRNPSQLPDGPLLVVGGGNSGCQIAVELAATRGVHLAVGQRLPALPQRFLGRDVFWWLTSTGLMRATADSRIGRRMRERDALIGSSMRGLRRAGVRLHPRLVEADGHTVRFADGSVAEVDAVVWATGYRPDHSWIGVPGVLDSDGRIVHRRGVTSAPGLYVLGQSWQHTRGSALLGFVQDDAAWLAERIADRTAPARRGAGAPPAHPLP